MKTNEEIIEECANSFNSELFKIVNGIEDGSRPAWGSHNCVMMDYRKSLSAVLEQKDKEHREKMIEVLEGMPLAETVTDVKIDKVGIHNVGYNRAMKELKVWQQNMINKLKQ